MFIIYWVIQLYKLKFIDFWLKIKTVLKKSTLQNEECLHFTL